MKLYLPLVLVLGFIGGCHIIDGDRTETADPNQNPRLGELREVFASKKAALEALLDGDGYPGRDDCDLTLWLGEACYAGIAVNLDLVEYAPGYVGRRPLPACWTQKGGDQGAKSSGSNDMQAGYMLCRWKEKNLGAFQRLAERGEAHKVYLPIPGWVMGDPYPEMASRVVMRPNGIGLVGRALFQLSGGQDDRSYRKWQSLYGPGADFERHVQAVSILTDGLVMEALRKGGQDATADGKPPTGTDFALLDVTMNELDALKNYAAAEPENYFYQAVLSRYSGETDKAAELLLNLGTPVPSYVRGAHQEAYELIHWLFAAKIVLERFDDTGE